jgi:hypothetical protein
MIGQILPNNNERCYNNFSATFREVNTPLLLNCVPFSAAVFGMGATNSSMMGMQQQQGVYGNMQAGAQNMQQGMVGLQNQTQNPNFTQQRQQNQQ